jgi:hypothetical protein
MAFGEGFYVTCLFLTLFALIASVAMLTGNEVAGSLATSMIGVVGTVAAFWFGTRGQTGGGNGA